jgi:hypothetical protein
MDKRIDELERKLCDFNDSLEFFDDEMQAGNQRQLIEDLKEWHKGVLAKVTQYEEELRDLKQTEKEILSNG